MERTIKEIVHSALRGEMDGPEISHWSRHFWDRGEFVFSLDPRSLDKVSAKGPSMGRYGGAAEVTHRTLYGEAGKPGCVIVTCPHDVAYDGNLLHLKVPPHNHSSDHITIVLEGGGTFVALRDVEGTPTLLLADAGPGMVFLYPAGILHTFIVGKQGIRVASAKSEFESPTAPHFAKYADDQINRFPRMAHTDYLHKLRSCSTS